MICVKCAREIPEGRIYCNICGHKQSSPVKRKPLKRANGTGSVTRVQGNRRKPWVAKKAVSISALSRLRQKRSNT